MVYKVEVEKVSENEIKLTHTYTSENPEEIETLFNTISYGVSTDGLLGDLFKDLEYQTKEVERLNGIIDKLTEEYKKLLTQ